MEQVVGPFSFSKAEAYLASLMDRSGAFTSGSYPVVGRLKSSYGYKKVSGVTYFSPWSNKKTIKIK